MPNLREFLSSDDKEEAPTKADDYPDEMIDKDFQFVIPLFKRAVKYIESSEGS